ncbi:MAG: GNAT family N-acetyltransferase, partial [Plesiomonas shigelloides]
MTKSADMPSPEGLVKTQNSALTGSVDINVLEDSSLCTLARVFHEAVWAQLSPRDAANTQASNDVTSAAHRYGYSEGQCRAWSGKVRDVRYWRSRLRGSLVLVAKVRGTAVGFIDCELGYRERGYIGHLYVAPAFQRCGIGGSLLQALM